MIPPVRLKGCDRDLQTPRTYTEQSRDSPGEGSAARPLLNACRPCGVRADHRIQADNTVEERPGGWHGVREYMTSTPYPERAYPASIQAGQELARRTPCPGSQCRRSCASPSSSAPAGFSTWRLRTLAAKKHRGDSNNQAEGAKSAAPVCCCPAPPDRGCSPFVVCACTYAHNYLHTYTYVHTPSGPPGPCRSRRCFKPQEVDPITLNSGSDQPGARLLHVRSISFQPRCLFPQLTGILHDHPASTTWVAG